MIYPKTRTRSTRIIYSKEAPKRTAGQAWRNRFLKAHRGGKKVGKGQSNDFIPECYNYAWGYF